MEVHHHPHVEKKNFKEYFLEFLMIFLAVTMGFFAESLRESLVNNEKEIHYIKSIMRDLNKDRAELSWYLNRQQLCVNKMDSALSILPARLNNVAVQDTFFHYFLHFYTFEYDFTLNDNTYTQLKNAGGFSVILNQKVIDSITGLYTFFDNQIKSIDGSYFDYYNKIVQLGTQLMDLPTIPVSTDDTLLTIIPSNKEFFIRVDIPLIRQLYSTIRYEEGSLLYYMKQERIYDDKAQELLQYLKKEYQL